MSVTQDRVIQAYKKLKQFVYYEKSNLYLREKLARFEIDDTEGTLQIRLKNVYSVLHSSNPNKNQRFIDWLEKIRYLVVPKSNVRSIDTGNDGEDRLDIVDSTESKGDIDRGTKDKDEPKCISNRHPDKSYAIDNVNFFFDGPIELYIICVLWIMEEGFLLDHLLDEPEMVCYGSRLDKCLGNNDDSTKLFRNYHPLYSNWRDNGISKAQSLLSQDRKSVIIVGLDIEKFFYNVDVDFTKLKNIIATLRTAALDESCSKNTDTCGLIDLVNAIHEAYSEVAKVDIETFYNVEFAGLLPIGLPSSPIFANWYLKEFDNDILHNLMPAYYGRYIDDILLVFSLPPLDDPSTLGICNRVNDILLHSGVF